MLPPRDPATGTTSSRAHTRTHSSMSSRFGGSLTTNSHTQPPMYTFTYNYTYSYTFTFPTPIPIPMTNQREPVEVDLTLSVSDTNDLFNPYNDE